MGQEIERVQFAPHDFQRFQTRLREETAHLGQWFRDKRFVARSPRGGFEVEIWLVDENMRPACINREFLERLDNPLVVPELAKFNVEINSTPRRLCGGVLQTMEAELNQLMTECRAAAKELGAQPLLIGILPTIRQADLCLENMSAMQRFGALNDQIMRLRGGRPVEVDIRGAEQLRLTHEDVMLESAATSTQIHRQITQAESVRMYNAAQIISAPITAVCANSPFFCGKALWDETRIPLFEQSVSVHRDGDPTSPADRVLFGESYVQDSLMSCFRENLDRFITLVPASTGAPAAEMRHVRFHNGTIWRWNRPLVDFGESGKPHLRIEHRVISAGPSIVDTIANIALFFGLLEDLGRDLTAERDIPCARAKANFYLAAKHGLRARIVWKDGRRISVRKLLAEELIPRARRGLESLDVDLPDIDRYLGIVSARVKTSQSGARWQRDYFRGHGQDTTAMTAAYLENQLHGAPVHQWQT